MTTAPEVAARRAHREAQRDAQANTDVRPGTGPNSSVSPQALTRIAQAAPAATRGPGQATSQGLSGDLATSVNAATLPSVGPGQARTGTGAREGAQVNQSRGTGKDGQTR